MKTSLACLIIAFLSSPIAWQANTMLQKPNIALLFIDDQAWNDAPVPMEGAEGDRPLEDDEIPQRQR